MESELERQMTTSPWCLEVGRVEKREKNKSGKSSEKFCDLIGPRTSVFLFYTVICFDPLNIRVQDLYDCIHLFFF